MTVQLNYIFLLYLIIINLIGFFIMKIDKNKAIKGLWRIPEKTLFIIALIGGSFGCICGMYHFHHKTKHFSFVFGMPLILIAEIILLIFICLKQLSLTAL